MAKLLWPWHSNTDLACATPLLSFLFMAARRGEATLERPLRGLRRLDTCGPTPNDHAAVRLGGEETRRRGSNHGHLL